MDSGTIHFQNETHKCMDVQAFVTTFPELKAGLDAIHAHYGELTEMSITIAGYEYSFFKTSNQPIPKIGG